LIEAGRDKRLRLLGPSTSTFVGVEVPQAEEWWEPRRDVVRAVSERFVDGARPRVDTQPIWDNGQRSIRRGNL
jgi:hypothetical protein